MDIRKVRLGAGVWIALPVVLHAALTGRRGPVSYTSSCRQTGALPISTLVGFSASQLSCPIPPSLHMQGHAVTVEKVLKWLDEEGGVKGTTVCDAGCGTGGSNTELMTCSDRNCNAALSSTQGTPVSAMEAPFAFSGNHLMFPAC